jgi:manganese transport protein
LGRSTGTRWLATLGTASLVSVGYLDPGNWATDIEGGARFGYELLWVLLFSNVVALLLQGLSAKLGIATGLSLAAACRRCYSAKVSFGLWLLAEVAIVACDLAELIGSAIALELLFGVPLALGAALTSFDVLLILLWHRRGGAWLELIAVGLLLGTGACVLANLLWAHPLPARVVTGLLPRLHGGSLYVAIGIFGATVMPHNLYLQSGLVQRRGPARREVVRNWWSTALALNLALLLNAAILISAGTLFRGQGEAVDLREAHRLLRGLLGTGAASLLFALGLLCSGQSATLTSTLAGQIVMEGFLNLKLPAVWRRALTRGLAVVPALAVLSLVGDAGATGLLVVSQVVLSLQLPFAVIPLIRVTASSEMMGELANAKTTNWAGYACAGLVSCANMALVLRTIAQAHLAWGLAAVLVSITAAAAIFLCWLVRAPLRSEPEREQAASVSPA